MRIGLVGVGRIGASHAAVLAAADGVTELLITDADAGRAQGVAERLGATTVADPAALVAAGIDAMVVATPTTAHAELIVLAARSGIPVFCEKPVAADLASTLSVAEVVAQTSALVQIGFQRRFDAGYRAARAAVADGSLGQVQRVHAITADPAPPAAEYIPTSGGIFRDCHIHDFDIIRWVTGREVFAVSAFGSNLGADFFAAAGDVDTSAAVLELTGGALATLQGSRYNGAGYDVRMEVAGTLDTWAVGMDPRVPLHSTEGGLTRTGDAWPNFQQRFAAAYAAEIAAFLGLVADGGENPCTVDDALAALLIAEAADLSRREGRRVTVAEIG